MPTDHKNDDVKKLSEASSEPRRLQRRVWISGCVQGVGFRASTLREVARLTTVEGAASTADCLALRGFVKNLPDGRVEAIFSGEAEAVLALCAWCRRGPPHAQVTRLEVKEEALDVALPEFGVER